MHDILAKANIINVNTANPPSTPFEIEDSPTHLMV